MRRIAALVEDGRVILEEVHWDDSADKLAEIPADRFDVEQLVLKHVPGKIVYREILSSNGSGIYGVEDDPTALAEADWQEPQPEALTEIGLIARVQQLEAENAQLRGFLPKSASEHVNAGLVSGFSIKGEDLPETTDRKPWRVEPRRGMVIKGPTRFATYDETYPMAQAEGRVHWDPRPEEERFDD